MTLKKTITFMILSTFSFALMNVTVKYLSNIHAFQLVFFRSLGSLVFTFGYLLRHKIPIMGNQRKLLVLRGIVGVTSMTLFFMSMKYLPVATAVSLRYIAPIFAAIFAVLFLKEQIKPVQWLFFMMAFSGVVVLKGFDTELQTYGLVLVLLAAVFSGLVYTVINKIGTKDHPVVVVNYFMVIATLTGGLLSINHWTTPHGMEWPLLGLLGVFGYFGQVYMTKAFQSAATGLVAPMKYIEVIFTLIIGILWFKDVYSFWSFLGILLIVGGLILNISFKERQKRTTAKDSK
ncbi:DMT family transporter [Mangrovimonas sp. YM274]|uniref:DMT family transporter n=1 Tax=Mangrovimonas sp. YM274 TaxID=3070660 RepID=UPI0027DBFC66|nr:DMT family transporter [Mangrovimonas sp. YM274]WMI67337.1 DMT family transporter [Mangrovimonas sp. YM274]